MNNFLYDGYLRNFIYRDLGRKLHMSFDDFISRPRYEIESILRIVDEVDSKKMKSNETILKEVEKANETSKANLPGNTE